MAFSGINNCFYFLLTDCALRNTKYVGTQVYPSYRTTANTCSVDCFNQEDQPFCYFWSFNKFTGECFRYDQGIIEIVDLEFISGNYTCIPYV
jgi:hypothetical protein